MLSAEDPFMNIKGALFLSVLLMCQIIFLIDFFKARLNILGKKICIITKHNGQIHCYIETVGEYI